jgi:putative heme-binding domain-containing protein
MAAVLDAARKVNGAGYGALVQELLESSVPASRILGCKIIAAVGVEKPELASKVETLLARESAATAERIAAMAALAKVRGKAALTDILKFTENPDPALKIGALAAVAPVDPAAVAKRSLPLLDQTRSSKDVAELLAPLLSQKTGSAALAKAFQEQKPSAETAKRTLQWLSESGRDDAALRDALTHAAGLKSASTEYNEALVKQWVADAAARGDSRLGETVFKAAQTTCLTCHKVGNEGGILGPELSAIGRAMTPEMIVESVFWPKRQVKEGYMLTQITTKDGQVQQGYKASETPDTLTLKDLAGNPTAPILKSRIASRSDAGSLMPDGLMAPLSEKEQLNLFKYLFELGK